MTAAFCESLLFVAEDAHLIVWQASCLMAFAVVRQAVFLIANFVWRAQDAFDDVDFSDD